MKQKKIESNALIISTIVNAIITLSGMWVYWVTGIQALFLDCVFSLIAFISTLLATTISKTSRRKTVHYPNGLHFLEPLYAILKSLLILFLLAMSIGETSKSAYNYFVYGTGEIMNISPVLPYTVAMVVLCFGLGFFNRHQNKKINDTSTILTAECKGNFIDGLQSLGIGVAVVLLYFVDKEGSLGFLWYTGDFFITLVLVIISIKEPVTVLYHSVKELTNGTTHDKEILSFVNGTIEKSIVPITKKVRCEIIKTGMYIDIRLFLHEEITLEKYMALMQAKKDIYKKINQKYENISISYIL